MTQSSPESSEKMVAWLLFNGNCHAWRGRVTAERPAMMHVTRIPALGRTRQADPRLEVSLSYRMSWRPPGLSSSLLPFDKAAVDIWVLVVVWTQAVVSFG